MMTSLKKFENFFLLFLSFFLVGFGQPAWSWLLGLTASCVGYAVFWRVLIDISSKTKRFYLAWIWFACVQLVQLSWMVSHPYYYIYGVLIFCAMLMGFQFGIIGLFIEKDLFSNFYKIFAVAGLWTLLEWSRLFILSGLSFNPTGIALTGSLYSLQFASIGGVYFLTFWILLTNLFVLRTWLLGFRLLRVFGSVVFVAMPYLFGSLHIWYHARMQEWETSKKISAVLVQTAFPVEETMSLDPEELRQYVLEEWTYILALLKPHENKLIDLIALPEYVVPYGTYWSVFPLKEVKNIFQKKFGDKYINFFPPMQKPFAEYVRTYSGFHWYVSNAFIVQSIANLFHTDIIVGFEDNVFHGSQEKESFSSAFHFSAGNKTASRYDKRVLVPMGEYIPFSFCRELAARYGIVGSFTPGKEAKVFSGNFLYSPSICYEETYGHMMSSGRKKGAELFVNLTNDGWYPYSRLPQQHFDHARLRTVENGVPLVRACNTGVTAGVDSLGRIRGCLKYDSFNDQHKAGALHVEIPSYHYRTLYSLYGDIPIISLSFFCLLGFFTRRKSF